jgi:hypothetical protein
MRQLAIVVYSLLAQVAFADCRDCYYNWNCAFAHNGGYGEYCDYFYDSSWNIQYCCCSSISACAFIGSACACNEPDTPYPTPEPTTTSTPSPTPSSSPTPADSNASQSGASMGFDTGIGIGISIGIGLTLVLVAIAYSCNAKLRRQTPLPSTHNSHMSASALIMGGARVPVLQGGKVNYINPSKH